MSDNAMTKPKKYEIRRLGDFIKVPADRRADCLSEFLEALQYADDALASALSKADQLPRWRRWMLGRFGVVCLMPRFVWVDDDKRQAEVTINDRITGADTGRYFTGDYQERKPERIQ